jgi:hypothetical protein
LPTSERERDALIIAEKLLIKPRTTVWISHPQHLAWSSRCPRAFSRRPAMVAAIAVAFGDNAQSVRNVGQVSLGRGWSAVRFRLWGERNSGPWADAKSAGPH